MAVKSSNSKTASRPVKGMKGTGGISSVSKGTVEAGRTKTTVEADKASLPQQPSGSTRSTRRNGIVPLHSTRLSPMPKRVKVHDQTLQFRVGAEYSDATSFYELARLACFQHGFHLMKNGTHLRCNQSCPWSLEFGDVPGSQKIKIVKLLNEHDHCDTSHLSTFRSFRTVERSTPGTDELDMDESEENESHRIGDKRKRDGGKGKSRAESETYDRTRRIRMTQSPIELDNSCSKIKVEPIPEVSDRAEPLEDVVTPASVKETPPSKRLGAHLATPPTEQIERSAQDLQRRAEESPSNGASSSHPVSSSSTTNPSTPSHTSTHEPDLLRDLESFLLSIDEAFVFHTREPSLKLRLDFLAPLLIRIHYDTPDHLRHLQLQDAELIISELKLTYEAGGSEKGIVAEVEWKRMRNRLEIWLKRK